MVLLTATDAIIAAVQQCRALPSPQHDDIHKSIAAPSITDLKPGDPIPHDLLVRISKHLRIQHTASPPEDASNGSPEPPTYHLDHLLRGSQIYIPPPPPKPEPTAEYKALMARLRAAQEQQAYARMLAPPPSTSAARNPFATSRRERTLDAASYDAAADDDDEVTYADIDRQLTLIFNILVSVVACGVAIWVVARYWDTPSRLFVSIGGASVVGVAEVVIYTGYLRRVRSAKETERRIVERKEVLDTWVIKGRGKKEKSSAAEVLGGDVKELRMRKGKKP